MDSNERQYLLSIAADLRDAAGYRTGKHLGKRERKVIALAKRLEELAK